MTDYCTLAQARSELKASSTIDDEKLRGYIRKVSKRIDSTMGTHRRSYFAPNIEQRRRNINGLNVNSYDNSLILDRKILAFSEVLTGTTDITSMVEIYAPYNEVAEMLRITSFQTSWYNACGGSDTPPLVARVTGTWGWHEDYANAWDSVDTLQAGINATETEIEVANVDGTNSDYFTPRISAGNLIRINDEFMEVLSTDTATNKAIVKRGVNGTTAAIQAIGDAVEVFQVDDRINRVATRQAALLYARRGAFQSEDADGAGTIAFPQDLLSELKGVLQEFQYA